MTSESIFFQRNKQVMAERKSIEKEIVKELSSKVSPLGFFLKDKEINLFECKKENVKYDFSFYLTEYRAPYSLFMKASITYLDLTKIINSLLEDTELKDYFQYGVGITKNDYKIIKDTSTMKISSIDETKSFTDKLYERIKKIKENFYLPHSNTQKQIETFQTETSSYWFNGIPSQNIAICVSQGFINKDNEIIKTALQKDPASLSERSQSYEKDKLLITILKNKLLPKTNI